jgi:hypothetical protein
LTRLAAGFLRDLVAKRGTLGTGLSYTEINAARVQLLFDN